MASSSDIGDTALIYQKSKQYWDGIDSTVDGMLGGFQQLHAPDVDGSKKLLTGLRGKNHFKQMQVALDCGAGVGRVTKHTLMPFFDKVDMVDVIATFIEDSKKYMGKDENKIGERFVSGLQDFVPIKSHYDCIWIQWVSGYLSDKDFVKFFERCGEGLREGGVIVLKDNLGSNERPDFDEEDSSWARPHNLIISLLNEAGMEIIEDKRQTHFPKGMYEVRMFAMKPKL
uniref:Alpha N-terminal protein methyltransferase 1 n=1 Tax=Rhabditophanes sp. KR3021 TaxID=114890 RepID=A0AC35TSU7_9BILA